MGFTKIKEIFHQPNDVFVSQEAPYQGLFYKGER